MQLPDYGYVLYAEFSDQSTSLFMWADRETALLDATPALALELEDEGLETFRLHIVRSNAVTLTYDEGGFAVSLH